MKCHYYLQDAQDLLADGKTLYERRFGESLKDQLFHLVHWLEYLPNPRETKREFINSERKYYQESF